MHAHASSMPAGSGSSPTRSATTVGASDAIVSPRSSGPRRASRNSFCQSPSGLAESRAGLRQHDGFGDDRIVDQQLLHDHAADRMPDEDGFGRADLEQKILQRVGKRGNADALQRRRSAIARHVPRDGAISIAEGIELPAPYARGAADAMQEHQRRQIGRARGLIAEAAVVGFQGRGIGHQGLRCVR